MQHLLLLLLYPVFRYLATFDLLLGQIIKQRDPTHPSVNKESLRVADSFVQMSPM